MFIGDLGEMRDKKCQLVSMGDRAEVPVFQCLIVQLRNKDTMI